MFVNGPDARKGLPVSTIASTFISFSCLTSHPHHSHRRHQALHAAKSQSNICGGCKKTFSRLDALNVRRYCYLFQLVVDYPLITETL
jgi:hypothetical protein